MAIRQVATSSTPPSVVLIEHKVSDGTSGTLTFSGIPAGYKTLLLRWNSTNSLDAGITMTLNNDGGANYNQNNVGISNAGVLAGSVNAGATSFNVRHVGSGIGTTGSFGFIEIDNSSTQNKFVNGSSSTLSEWAWLFNGNYVSATEISRLDLILSAGVWSNGGLFSLWGLK